MMNVKTRGLNQKRRNMAEQTNDGIAVETFPLQQVLDRADIGVADVVKMNIHGSEYDVLMGSPAAALRRCRRIVVSTMTCRQAVVSRSRDYSNIWRNWAFGCFRIGLVTVPG